jgi:hypothetical protein
MVARGCLGGGLRVAQGWLNGGHVHHAYTICTISVHHPYMIRTPYPRASRWLVDGSWRLSSFAGGRLGGQVTYSKLRITPGFAAALRAFAWACILPSLPGGSLVVFGEIMQPQSSDIRHIGLKAMPKELAPDADSGEIDA